MNTEQNETNSNTTVEKESITPDEWIREKVKSVPDIGFSEEKINFDEEIDLKYVGKKILLECNNCLYSAKINRDCLAVSLVAPFTLELEQVNIGVNNEIPKEEQKKTYSIKVTPKDRAKKPLRVEIGGEVFTDLKSFKKKLSSMDASLILYATEKQFVEITNGMFEKQNTAECLKFNRIGLNKSTNDFIWKNAVQSLTNNQIHFIQNGSQRITVSDKVCEIEIPHEAPILKPFTGDEQLPVIKSFFDNFFEWANSAEVIMAFGATLATLYAEIFWEKAEGMPWILWFGESASGKSTLQKCLAGIFGYKNIEGLSSGTSTAFAIRESLASQYNVPVFIEEAEQEVIDKLGILGKDMYSKVGRRKGRKDGSISQTNINTTMSVTSNHFFSKPTPQVVSRCVIANLNRNDLNLSKCGYFGVEEREQLSAMLPKMLMYRSFIMGFYKRNYGLIRQIEGTQERYHNNLAIALSVWDVVFSITQTTYFDKNEIIKKYLLSYKPYLEQVNFGDYIMGMIGTFILRGLINYDDVYRLTKDTTVRLSLKKFLAVYNIVYPEKAMTSHILKIKLKKDKRFNLDSNADSKIGRAIFIDIAENDELLELIHRNRR